MLAPPIQLNDSGTLRQLVGSPGRIQETIEWNILFPFSVLNVAAGAHGEDLVQRVPEVALRDFACRKLREEVAGELELPTFEEFLISGDNRLF